MHNVCLPCHRIHACASTGNIRPRRSKSRKPAPRTNSVVSSSCTASFFLHYSGKRTACKEKTAGVSAGEMSAVSHGFQRVKKASVRLKPGHGAAKNPVISAFPKGAASPAPDNARSTRAPCGRSSALRYDPLQNIRILKQHVAAKILFPKTAILNPPSENRRDRRLQPGPVPCNQALRVLPMLVSISTVAGS